MRSNRSRSALAAVGSLLLIAACAGGAGSAASSAGTTANGPAAGTAGTRIASLTATTAIPRPAHIVLVVLENHAQQQIIGNSNASYLNALRGGGAYFSQSYGVTHPSEPNYLALFSGSPQGITDDSCPHTFAANNLGQQLIAAGLSFGGYSEGLPALGSTVCASGRYARKHNPWVNFSDLPSSVNRPSTAFPSDYTRLPTVSWVIPNLCNDMHDCSVATGDAWIQHHLGAYAQWARTHDSLLIVTFDEDDHSSANKIATIFYGQHAKPGTYPERVTHYGVLRTIEDMYGLAKVGSAASATPITDTWR